MANAMIDRMPTLTRGVRVLQKRMSNCKAALAARQGHEAVPEHLLNPKLVSLYGQTVTVVIKPGAEKTSNGASLLWENVGADKRTLEPVQYTGVLRPANSAERRREIVAIVEVPHNGTTLRVSVPPRALESLF